MKNKTKKIIKALMILTFGLLFLFVIVKSKINQNDIICTKIVVDIKDKKDLQFISEKDVLRTINSQQENQIINKKISEINLKIIEEKLEQNDFIDNAEVYSNFEGIIKVDIVQKKPLYRIINNKNVSYYISDKSYKVPLSANFTPRLILTTGYIPEVEDISTDNVNKNLKKLIDFIHLDTFWESMISQVIVEKNGDFVLIPKLKGHTVLLGDVNNLNEKFKKLKAFYQQGLKKTDWTKYKQINLKYKGQLICSK